MGANVIVTDCELPAAIVPHLQDDLYALLTLLGAVIPDTVSMAFPEFAMVNVRVAVEPATTSPNTRSPVSPIIRVATGGVGVAPGVVGEFELLHDETSEQRTSAVSRRCTVVVLEVRSGIDKVTGKWLEYNEEESVPANVGLRLACFLHPCRER